MLYLCPTCAPAVLNCDDSAIEDIDVLDAIKSLGLVAYVGVAYVGDINPHARYCATCDCSLDYFATATAVEPA